MRFRETKGHYPFMGSRSGSIGEKSGRAESHSSASRSGEARGRPDDEDAADGKGVTSETGTREMTHVTTGTS